MTLVYFRGLNCHLACAISIAASLGIRYPDAFGTLWSETDFAEEPRFGVRLSRRIFPNLEALGAGLDTTLCACPADAARCAARIPEGEAFIVGMDTFDIPWSAVCRSAHEPHYFIARKQDGALVCFDPTYDKRDLRPAAGPALERAFEFGRLQRPAGCPPRFCASREARAALAVLPALRERLRAELEACAGQDPQPLARLIRQVGALLNNRHLFARFLHQTPAPDRERHFDRAFLARWEGVYNGLLKASIVKDRARVIGSVRALLDDLLAEELALAAELGCSP